MIVRLSWQEVRFAKAMGMSLREFARLKVSDPKMGKMLEQSAKAIG